VCVVTGWAERAFEWVFERVDGGGEEGFQGRKTRGWLARGGMVARMFWHC